MADYRRNYVPGGTYFFTFVTHLRRPILTDELARNCLHHAIDEVRHNWPFEILATVLIPDHIHTVWSLPAGDSDYSLRIRRIKELFTRRYLAASGKELPQSTSRAAKAYRGVWQKRFWEHTVRDDEDLKHCTTSIGIPESIA